MTEPHPLETRPKSSFLRLLLVEDDAVDRMAFLRFIATEKLNYEVRVASSIAEGREALTTGAFDVIILDHRLKDGLSFELLEWVGDTPVIYVTGVDSPESAVQAMQRGARDYLVKDTDRNYLRLLPTAVERALKLARAESEHVHVVEALRESQKHLGSIINSVDGIVWEADAITFQFSFVSQRAERLLGYPVNVWTAEPGFWAGHLHPDDRDAAIDFCRKCTLETRDHELEYRLRARDGRYVWLRDLVSVVMTDGKASKLRGLMVDITERKQADQKFRALLESAPDAMVIINREGKIVLVNSQTEKLFGYGRDEMIGQPNEMLMPERYRAGHPLHRGEYFQDPKHRPMGSSLPTIARRKDGAEFPVEISLSPLETEEGLLISSSIRDMTERRSLEEQLRQSQKMEAIGQLAGGIAHDFNNLSATIILQTECLLELKNLPEEVREGVREIRAAADRAAALTRQLLLFSRRQTIQTQLVDLNNVVASLAKMLRRTIGENIQIQLQPHAAPLCTQADVVLLDQVLLNLILNARDSMPNGGQLIIQSAPHVVDDSEARVNPESSPGRYACLTVSDTGCGIPQELLPKIFDPFFTTKASDKGTGLGLATVFGIVKQHRGWINVESRLTAGTTFRIYLPESSTGPETVKPGAPALKHRGAGETILLVEDEESLRRSTHKILERCGYRVLEAGNGPEALKIWNERGGEVALLLTDLIMPGGMSGRELASQIQSQHQGLKVLFSSGYSPEIAGKELSLKDGQNFIQKPFAADKLLESIRSSLDA